MGREEQELAILVSAKDAASRVLKNVRGNVGALERAAARGARNAGRNIERAAVTGAIAVAGLGVAAAKTAIDFEDAFAAVRKTIEGTPKQLEDLRLQLRELATRVPVPFEDIAAVAAEAGALGVPTNQVAKFTEVVVRLSAATQGLTVEMAAEAFGKFRTVLHLTDAELTAAGSSLIALGNAGASSEGDIIMVAKRFAAAGSEAKLSAAEVLGWSSAIASMGVEPEAAGSSLSRLFNNITKYIGTGNAKIKAFASTSGESVKAFSKLFRDDATGAVELFLQKLGKMDRFKASAVLKKAGITNVRDINAVLLLSQNYKELDRQLDLSSDAFKKGTALQEVSEKRFKTTANQVTILKNNMREAGAVIGEALLPEINELVGEGISGLQDLSSSGKLKEFAHDVAGQFHDMVTWAKSLDWGAIAGALNAGAGAAKLLVGAFMAMPPFAQELLAGGFAANKLTGGAVTDIVGILGKGLIKGVLGMNAGVVNINAGVVNGAGGMGGVAGAAKGGLAGKLGTGLAVGLAATAIGGAVETYFTQKQGIENVSGDLAKSNDAMLANSPSVAALKQSLGGINDGIDKITSNPLNMILGGDALTNLQAMKTKVESQLQVAEAAARSADSWMSESVVEAQLIHAAVVALPAQIAAALPAPVHITYASSPVASGDARHSGTSTYSSTTSPAAANDTRHAAGAVGMARMPHRAIFGEAGTEGVAIVRNPRPILGLDDALGNVGNATAIAALTRNLERQQARMAALLADRPTVVKASVRDFEASNARRSAHGGRARQIGW